MISLSHIAGIPVEETLASMAGAGAGLALAGAWVRVHLRRHK